WTHTVRPCETSFLTVSGVAATLVSPAAVSAGTPIRIAAPLVGDELIQRVSIWLFTRDRAQVQCDERFAAAQNEKKGVGGSNRQHPLDIGRKETNPRIRLPQDDDRRHAPAQRHGRKSAPWRPRPHA